MDRTIDSSNQAMLIKAPVYNGEYWTKLDLLVYIEEAIKLRAQVMAYMETSKQRRERQAFLTSQMEKKQLTYPTMQKPSFLQALLPGKRRQYQEWLTNAPQREAEQIRFSLQEDARIQELKKEYQAISEVSKIEYNKALKITEQYKQHMHRHVVPPDYRGDEPLRMLFEYLMNGRAHTLTDAINLYHQEQHWRNLEDIAEKQRRDIERAQQEQNLLLRQQIAEQREQTRLQAEHMAELQSTADSIRRSAENAEFWQMMEYVSVQSYLNR